MKPIDLSEKNLAETHVKSVEMHNGFMFHDLKGRPMMIKDFTVTTWKPKKK